MTGLWTSIGTVIAYAARGFEGNGFRARRRIIDISGDGPNNRGIYVLPVGSRAFRVWARLMHRYSDELIEDAIIAATAIVHDLTVVTRNLRDFRPLGVKTLDPFAPQTFPQPDLDPTGGTG